MHGIFRMIFSAMISIAFSAAVFAEKIEIDYYGVVSPPGADANMLKMAQDIFLTQLKSLDSVAVRDLRPDTAKTSESVPQFVGNAIAFYAEISEENGEKKTWKCRFNAFNPQDEITHSKSQEFDSYYKILANAKSAIESVILPFKSKDEKIAAVGKIEEKSRTEPKTFEGNIDIESLAGTWSGEPYTDKILILRGGRGFIIFKNGATMNIKISAKKYDARGNVMEIEIRQIGKSNASFFPELPRQTALSLAATAKPILWNFSIQAGELYGTKQTLVPAENELGAEEGTIAMSWSKR